MPYNAIQRVEVDHIVPLPRIAGAVSDLASQERSVIPKKNDLPSVATGFAKIDQGIDE